jgi:hypothetical protein
MNAYNIRNAGAVMHSHSSKVVLGERLSVDLVLTWFVASLIFGNEFRISHIEMIKGKVFKLSFLIADKLSLCGCFGRLYRDKEGKYRSQLQIRRRNCHSRKLIIE